jgi:hypothetical protein
MRLQLNDTEKAQDDTPPIGIILFVEKGYKE